MTDDEILAPVDYLVMEFPPDALQAPGLDLLADIIEVGVGRVLDLVFIRKEPDASISIIDVTSLPSTNVGLDLSSLVLAPPGHRGEAEIAAAASHIDVGSTAGILVFANARVQPDVVVPLQRKPSTPSIPPLLAGSAG
jgi:hypothetical protein